MQMETLTSSNPSVRILRTPSAATKTPKRRTQRNEVVYSQGGAMVVSKRITADQASSLLKRNEPQPAPAPTAPTAIEGSTQALARSAEQSMSTTFKRIQKDASVPTTIVVRGK